MSDMAHADIMGQLCLQNIDLASISILNDAIIGKDGRKAMGNLCSTIFFIAPGRALALLQYSMAKRCGG